MIIFLYHYNNNFKSSQTSEIDRFSSQNYNEKTSCVFPIGKIRNKYFISRRTCRIIIVLLKTSIFLLQYIRCDMSDMT